MQNKSVVTFALDPWRRLSTFIAQCSVLVGVMSLGADAVAQFDAVGPGWLQPHERRSGLAFKSEDLQNQQNDDAINPGFLWVDQGAKLWSESPSPQAPSCQSCHLSAPISMKGVALKYPLWNAREKRLINLDKRINECRVKKQHAQPLPYESDEMLALSSWITLASRGMKLENSIDQSLVPAFERGKAFYEKRIGQNNLSCAHCHTAHLGQRLGGEIISQGQPHAYPAYRLEWQKMGSLQRRLRACLSGVKAAILPFGSEELLEMEVYLNYRGQGLRLESPGVRR